MLFEWWISVVQGWPALIQHWVNASCVKYHALNIDVFVYICKHYNTLLLGLSANAIGKIRKHCCHQ